MKKLALILTLISNGFIAQHLPSFKHCRQVIDENKGRYYHKLPPLSFCKILHLIF
jgi:hypothetical protein